METKLSKEAEKSVKLLQEINKKIKEYEEIINKLEKELNNPKLSKAEKSEKVIEINLIGGMVIGIYSPIGGIGIIGASGNNIITDGLRKQLEQPLNPFEDMFKL